MERFHRIWARESEKQPKRLSNGLRTLFKSGHDGKGGTVDIEENSQANNRFWTVKREKRGGSQKRPWDTGLNNRLRRTCFQGTGIAIKKKYREWDSKSLRDKKKK